MVSVDELAEMCSNDAVSKDSILRRLTINAIRTLSGADMAKIIDGLPDELRKKVKQLSVEFMSNKDVCRQLKFDDPCVPKMYDGLVSDFVAYLACTKGIYPCDLLPKQKGGLYSY